MRKLPTKWIESIIVGTITVVLVGGFLFAWHHQATPAPQTGGPTSPGSPTHSRSPSKIEAQLEARTKALAELRKKAQERSHKLAITRPVATFTFAQFNTLGAAHTAGGGIKAKRPNGGLRTAWMVQLLNDNHVDVAAFQEFERSQQQAFARLAGGVYEVFPGLAGRAGDAENSVAWRRDEFDLVRAETRPYPYFNGNVRNMPRVLLQDKATGVRFWVTSYHNAANIRKYGNQDRWRHQAMNMQVADANELLSTQKFPLIISGDMNDRQVYFCAMVGRTPMHAANGGTASGGSCSPPHPIWIDWILGSDDIEFTGFVTERSALIARTSDHPLLVTGVAVTGQPGDRPVE